VLPLRHDPADLGAFDEAVEDHDRDLLVLVGELIDLAVQAVQFGVVDSRLRGGLFLSGSSPGQA
jgi:hypothetical protein